MPPVLILNPCELTQIDELNTVIEAKSDDDEEESTSYIDYILKSIMIGKVDETQMNRIEIVKNQVNPSSSSQSKKSKIFSINSKNQALSNIFDPKNAYLLEEYRRKEGLSLNPDYLSSSEDEIYEVSDDI